MTSQLFVFADRQEVQRPDGITSVRLTPGPVGDQQFVMGITSFPPGASVPLHSHDTVEQVTVLQGTGQAELNGELRSVEPFDATQIPPGEVHRFLNTGDEMMRILWVYGSLYVMRTWVETGEIVEQFDLRP